MTYPKIAYSKNPLSIEKTEGGKEVHCFENPIQNYDDKTLQSFGAEWNKFNHFDDDEITQTGHQYFDLIDLRLLKDAHVLDIGCGIGRWSKFIAPYVAYVDAIDPSSAIDVASKFLYRIDNVRLAKADIDALPFEDDQFDLVISLGVLHHLPNTFLALKTCEGKLKKGGQLLVYIYYNLDNRGPLFKTFFKVSNLFRKVISRLPEKVKFVVCDIIAWTVYIPLVVLSKFLKRIGLKKLIKSIPLSFYHDKSLNIIRNDALDRFGTPLEQRFSKKEIYEMMKNCGLTDIRFSAFEPYHHAVGTKK